jgi:hypothetical protein
MFLRSQTLFPSVTPHPLCQFQEVLRVPSQLEIYLKLLFSAFHAPVLMEELPLCSAAAGEAPQEVAAVAVVVELEVLCNQ